MVLPTFDDDAALRPKRVNTNARVQKISNAPFLPLSVRDVALFLKWDLAEEGADTVTDGEDANITMVITAVRDWWEHHTGIVLLRSTWKQTQDAIADGLIPLYRGPVISITTIHTVPGFFGTDATPVLLSSSLYALVGNQVYSDSWPAHRGKSSVIVTYQGGLVDWDAADENAPTTNEIATAQALVPVNHKLGMLNAIGHLLENREGAKAVSKYEVDAKLAGLTPPNSELMAVGVSNLSLLGRCWR